MVSSNPALSAAVFVTWEFEGWFSFDPALSQRARDRSIRLFIHLLIVVTSSTVVVRCNHQRSGLLPTQVRYLPKFATPEFVTRPSPLPPSSSTPRVRRSLFRISYATQSFQQRKRNFLISCSVTRNLGAKRANQKVHLATFSVNLRGHFVRHPISLAGIDQKDGFSPWFFRSLETKSTDRIFANTTEEETAITFNDIGYLSIATRRAVLQVINNTAVAV